MGDAVTWIPSSACLARAEPVRRPVSLPLPPLPPPDLDLIWSCPALSRLALSWLGISSTLRDPNRSLALLFWSPKNLTASDGLGESAPVSSW